MDFRSENGFYIFVHARINRVVGNGNSKLISALSRRKNSVLGKSLKPNNWGWGSYCVELMIFVTILHDTFSHKDELIDVACV